MPGTRVNANRGLPPAFSTDALLTSVLNTRGFGVNPKGVQRARDTVEALESGEVTVKELQRSLEDPGSLVGKSFK